MDNKSIKTVMVLGATGNLGPYITSSLLEAGFQVSILTRRPPKTTSDLSPDINVSVSDYSFTSLVQAFTGQDAVISTISAANLADQNNIIDAAAAAKVKRFMPSEFGSDTSIDGLEEIAPFLKSKQEVLEYLRSKEKDGLSWTALYPGIWLDWVLLQGQGLLGFDITSKTGTMFDSGDAKFTTTSVTRVGKATASVLLHPNETRNQYVQVSSFNLTQNMVLEALENAAGQKFAMGQMSVAELTAAGNSSLEKGDWEKGYFELVNATVYGGTDLIYFPEKAERWNQILELGEDESLDDMARRLMKT